MTHIKIKRALIAVFDKTGVAEFARALVEEFGIEIISTGGTARHLKEAGIPVTLVEAVTGFPEMLDGRVKTLHPKIHAAILADRDNPEHMRQLAEQGIKPIDMVVVNLYPFEQTTQKPDCTFEDAIEMIDIGGPCLLRAAAKNHRHVVVVHQPRGYERTLDQLRSYRDEKDESAWRDMHESGALGAFRTTTGYDAQVSAWLSSIGRQDGPPRVRVLRLSNQRRLRYGENPHQQGELSSLNDDSSTANLTAADAAGDSDAGMSFNNYVDASAALELCAELTRASVILLGSSREEPRASARAAHRTPSVNSGREEPRASARAAHRAPIAPDGQSVMQPPDPRSPCWLLTWTTYGSWLPGDERGFVSRTPNSDGSHPVRNVPGTPYDADQKNLVESAKEKMEGKPVSLTFEHAGVIHGAILEAAASHNVAILAFSIMRDHVHVVCQHAEKNGSELMQLFKGITSRQLGQQFELTEAPRWWTASGSKRYIRRGDDPQGAIDYVCHQNKPLCVRSFDASRDRGPLAPSSAARAEARGSSSPSGALCDREAARAEARGSSCCVFIKHTNACGACVQNDPIEAYRQAYLGDPNAAMGGILACCFDIKADFARTVMETYSRFGKEAGAGGFLVEVWIAPSFDEDAVEVIRSAKKWGERVRLLSVCDMSEPPDEKKSEYKSIAGGMLVQNRDTIGLNEDQWKVVTDRRPTDAEMDDLRLAWLICKHTKSNAITVCKDGMLIGNGAGQMSRVMSCRIATWLARENGHAERLPGSAAASDAFFPFRDGPDLLIDAGVTAIIQPGGSKRDGETITACNDRGVAMIHTGTRHFKH